MSIENENLKERFGRFRILVIGRPNAGKTTILKKICDSTENPEIYDAEGRKVWFSFWFRSYRVPMACDQVDHAQIQESREVSLSCRRGSSTRFSRRVPSVESTTSKMR